MVSNHHCYLCPRFCGAARTVEDPGFCGSDEGFYDLRVSSLMPHFGEERFISGYAGSGTIFFTGCSLRCCFCQNYDISHEHTGIRISQEGLVERIERLLGYGVHNLNLVTPSHYADRLPDLFARLAGREVWKSRPVPLIWNSSAYETVDSLLGVADWVDIYLVDMKFFDPGLAGDLTGAPDYADYALAAIKEMHRQQPEPVLDRRGLIQKGVVIRHLVLPGSWRDSIRILDELAGLVALNTPLSLLRQYTPRSSNPCEGHPGLGGRLPGEEYQRVLDHAIKLGYTHILKQ